MLLRTPGTDIRYAATIFAMCATDLGCAASAMRCPVLTYAMLLPVRSYAMLQPGSGGSGQYCPHPGTFPYRPTLLCLSPTPLPLSPYAPSSIALRPFSYPPTFLSLSMLPATRCPVLTSGDSRTGIAYAHSTAIAYAHSTGIAYAHSTGIAYAHSVRVSAYALPTPCPVLTQCKVPCEAQY
eukprot:3693824-Rhodomonas_salina.2